MKNKEVNWRAHTTGLLLQQQGLKFTIEAIHVKKKDAKYVCKDAYKDEIES